MSDQVNVDNLSAVASSISSNVDRWAWLKDIPNKIRRRPIPSKQVPDATEASKVMSSIDTAINEVQLSATTPLAPSESAEEPKLEKQQAEEIVSGKSVPVTANEEEPEKIPVKKRSLNISHILQEELTRLNMYVSEIETRGVPAIISTNETVGSGFFEAVHAKHPNGYLVGVGSGNVYSMLHVFEARVIPKGMVLADIDPRAVATGRLLIQSLKDSGTVADFQRRFFGMSQEEFTQKLQRIIAEEKNQALKRRWEATDANTWYKVWEDLSKREGIEWEDNRAYEYEGQNIDVVGAVLARFETLKQLADEDNIAMSYADFTNSDFIGAVKRLPEFDSSANVIYSSNIVDHITQRGTQIENATVMNALKAYENPVHQAIFIDTLGQGLNYFLRARSSLAEFTEDDFSYRGIQPRSQKPEGLLFADNANPNSETYPRTT